MTEATQGLYASGGTAAGDAASLTHLSSAASPGDDVTRQWSAVSESSERRSMLDTKDQNAHMSSQEVIYVATDSMRIREGISSSLLSDRNNQQHDIQETVDALIGQSSSDRDERPVGLMMQALTTFNETRDLESRVGASGSLYDDPTPHQSGHKDLDVPGDIDLGATRGLLALNEKVVVGPTQYQPGTIDFHEEILGSFAHSTNRHHDRSEISNALVTSVASHEERREVNEATRSTLKQESSKTGADLSHVSPYA